MTGDFEKVNGFQLLVLGLYDNVFYNRVISKGLKIDYNNFKHIKHPGLVMFWDSYNKKSMKIIYIM